MKEREETSPEKSEAETETSPSQSSVERLDDTPSTKWNRNRWYRRGSRQENPYDRCRHPVPVTRTLRRCTPVTNQVPNKRGKEVWRRPVFRNSQWSFESQLDKKKIPPEKKKKKKNPSRNRGVIQNTEEFSPMVVLFFLSIYDLQFLLSFRTSNYGVSSVDTGRRKIV